VQRAGRDAVPQRHHHLDHTGDPGGTEGVAEVRLHRAQQQRGGAVLAVGTQHGLGLDRVTQPRAGAVRLQDVHIGREQPGVGERGLDHALLRRPVGCGHAVGGAVGVDGRAAQHREDPLPVTDRVGQLPQHDDADTLRPADPVGVVGERLATTVGGQAAVPRELGELGGVRQDRDATRQGQRALAVPQRAGREVQRDQRRRARRVHRHGGAFQPERVRDAAGRDARPAADALVAAELVGVEQVAVVAVDDTGEHRGPAAAQRGRRDPGALQGLPRHLQQQPVLRVGGHRLAGRHVEEPGVEVGGAVEETADAGLLVRPAAVGGEGPDGVAAVGHQPPQVLRRAHSTGVPARHPHDRDRLVLPGLQLRHPLPRAPQVDGDPTEVVDDLVRVLTHGCCNPTIQSSSFSPERKSCRR
jgi:hypothetical protein